MMPVVEIQHVTKRYGTIEAVRDVSIELKQGETIALVGHNGAGKTTLLKLMLGLVHPTAGSLRVLGEDPAAGEFAARRRLGYLPENVSFNAALTGREILTFYARLKGEDLAKPSPCSSASAWKRPRRVASAPTRRACASGSAWLRPFLESRKSSYSTSRRRDLIPRCA